MPKRIQKITSETDASDPSVRLHTFICRDFTTKNGKKIKVDVKSNQTFKSFKTELQEEFKIQFDFNVYYDRHEISNTSELFDLLDIAKQAGREDEKSLLEGK